MNLKLALVIASLTLLFGCADSGVVTRQSYIVVVPPKELTELPAPERERAQRARQLDPEKADDKALGELMLDKQAYINALEKQLETLKDWYAQRIELLKKNMNLKPEDVRVVN